MARDARRYVELATETTQGTVNVATAEVASQQLVDEQLERFLRLTLDYTDMLKTIPAQNRIKMTTPTRQINRMAMPTHSAAMGLGDAEHMDEDEYTVPTYSKRELTPEPIEAHIAPTREQLLDNIERGTHEQTLDEELAKVFANDMEYAAIRADTSAAHDADLPTGLDNTIDGFRVKFADGNIYDANGGYVSIDLFENMILELPTPFQKESELSRFRFYCSTQVYRQWKRLLMDRETVLGDMMLTDGNIPAYSGVPLTPVSWFPNDEDGVTGTTQSATTGAFTYLFLCRPEELFIGYNPEWRRHAAWDYRDAKVLHIHLWARFDVQVSVPIWTVLGYNARPTISS